MNMLEEMDIGTGVNSDKVLEIGRRAVTLIGHGASSYILNAGRNKDLRVEMPVKKKK